MAFRLSRFLFLKRIFSSVLIACFGIHKSTFARLLTFQMLLDILALELMRALGLCEHSRVLKNHVILLRLRAALHQRECIAVASRCSRR